MSQLCQPFLTLTVISSCDTISPLTRVLWDLCLRWAP